MSDNSLRDKLVSYIQDSHAMEMNVMRMLDSLIATTKDEEMRARLQHHKGETELQIKRLKGRLQAYGEDPNRLKDVPALLGALTKGIADAVRSDKPGKNARDGFVTEHVEIASYELLERLARRAGDEETARVARENLEEERLMADFIASKWDRAIDLTLEDEGIVA